MKLYGHRASPRYRRIAIAAAELGIPLELVELDIPKGENRAAGYLAKNPMGKIPTLEEDDGWTLWESFAMVAYLGEKHPERGLFPTGVRERAEAMRWLFWAASHLDPAALGLYVQKVVDPARNLPTDPARVAAFEKELARYLPVLESHLQGRDWLLERFSLVDVALGATFDGLFHKRTGFDASPYPNVQAWHARLVDRPAWKSGSGR